MSRSRLTPTSHALFLVSVLCTGVLFVPYGPLAGEVCVGAGNTEIVGGQF